MLLQEFVDEGEWDVEVLHLLELGDRLPVELAKALLRDDLDELDQLEAVNKIRLEVLNNVAGDFVLFEVVIDPLEKGLQLHALSHRLQCNAGSARFGGRDSKAFGARGTKAFAHGRKKSCAK